MAASAAYTPEPMKDSEWIGLAKTLDLRIRFIGGEFDSQNTKAVEQSREHYLDYCRQ